MKTTPPDPSLAAHVNNPEPNASKFPSDLAGPLRTLLHDMSNALEIIVQSEYLLTTVAEMPDNSKDWLGLLSTGTKKAMELNLELREYVRAHS